MKSFCVAPEIVIAESCEEYFSQLNISSKDLLVTSDHIYNNYLEKYFSEATVIFIRKYGSGEPTDVMADNISEDIDNCRFSRVIAVGGGTALDIAKLFALKNHYPVCGLFSGEIKCEKNKELILIPTTCGTGSEVTNISVLELTKMGTKKGLTDNALFADQAVLIPQLLYTLPFESFASSSADALIHAIESYLSPKATTFSRTFSKSAIKSIISGYKYVAENGKGSQKDIAEQFLTASAEAGIAFQNAGCAAIHALSYPLGAACHCPHGKSNYIMLTGVMKKYEEKGGCESYSKLCDVLGKCLGCPADKAISSLDKLMSLLLNRPPLSSFGLSHEDLIDFAGSVYSNQQRLLSNDPIELTIEDFIDIYEKLY